MPIKVPTYDQPQVQERGAPDARLNVQTSTEAFGGGQSFENVTRAATGLAGEAHNFAIQEKRKADEVVLTDFNTKLTQAKNDLIYGANQTDDAGNVIGKSPGLVDMKGKDALGADEKIKTAYQQKVDELMQGLSNDSQRMMAKKMSAGFQNELDGEISRHVSQETRALDEQTTKAAIQTAQDDAILNYMNPEKVQLALEAQRGHVLRWADRNGVPEDSDIVKQQLEEVANKTHSGVIDRMLAQGKDMQAKKYYEQFSDQITGKDKIAVEKVLEEGTLRGESQRQSDMIMKEAGSSMSAALAKAKEIEDPKLRDQTVDRIKQEFAQRESADRYQSEQLMKKNANLIDRSSGGDIQKVIPPREWASLSVSEREALKKYAEHKRDGTQPQTDWQVYTNLVNMDKSDFLKVKMFEEYRNKLDDTRYHELVNLQAKLRNGDEKAANRLDGVRSDMDIINGALSDAGINHNAKPGTDEAKRVNMFKAKVDQEVMKYQDRVGKKITNDELKRITDNLMVEGFTDDGIFGTGIWRGSKRVFERTPQDDFYVKASSIPADERKKIEDALRRNNKKVTDQAVLQLFKRKVGGLSGGQ